VEAAIEVGRLEKRYGPRTALARVSFSVAPGEIVGLLGPNGAGKSTTLSILATTLEADAGTVRIAGRSLPSEANEVRRSLGYVPQRESLYPPLTAAENLSFFARMHGLGRSRANAAVSAALELVALDGRTAEPIATFSIGMRRRLNLAAGILHRPKVLLLDEPTVGVDPQSRERIFEAIAGLSREGAAVLYSTHYMEEAERLCQQVVLLDEGRVVASGTPASLVSETQLRPTVRLRTRQPLAEGWISRLDAIRIVRQTGADCELEVDDLARLPTILAAVVECGDEVRDVSVHRPNLADAFLALTGRALRDETSDEGG
jgi:ABC-2 type transport system ATP-binding protein